MGKIFTLLKNGELQTGDHPMNEHYYYNKKYNRFRLGFDGTKPVYPYVISNDLKKKFDQMTSGYNIGGFCEDDCTVYFCDEQIATDDGSMILTETPSDNEIEEFYNIMFTRPEIETSDEVVVEKPIEYNLLVRNNVPQMIIEDGCECTISQSQDFFEDTIKKIDVAYRSFNDKPDKKNMFNLITTLVTLYGDLFEVDVDEIAEMIKDNDDIKGTFSDWIILKSYTTK